MKERKGGRCEEKRKGWRDRVGGYILWCRERNNQQRRGASIP